MHVLDAAMICQLQAHRRTAGTAAELCLDPEFLARAVGAFAAIALAMTALHVSSPAVRAGTAPGFDHAEPRLR